MDGYSVNESFSDDDNISVRPVDIQPYQFEPLVSSFTRNNSEAVHSSAECSEEEKTQEISGDRLAPPASDSRIDNVAWCDCDKCEPMHTLEECVCCHEIDPISTILDDANLTCITDHEGFKGNCLNPYVIQVSVLEFVEVDGPLDDNEPIHELYRHFAYRRFTRWIWFKLGRGRRKVIPSYAVRKIGQAFPSESFTVFKYQRP